MIITRKNILEITEKLCKPGRYALDTETTGLRPYQGDRLFSVIIADETQAYYFNFQDYPDLDPDKVLPRRHIKHIARICANPSSYWYMHNAKFDLAMLYHEGIYVPGKVHCTLAIERVVYNQHPSYSLAACADRIGEAKDDAVEKYISKHKLYDWIMIPGKKKRDKDKHYQKVPLDIMAEYGERDAKITRVLGEHQTQRLVEISNDKEAITKNPGNVALNEIQLTKTCFQMEQTGIKIDRSYCQSAVFNYEAKLARCEEKWKELVPKVAPDFNKATALVTAFNRLKLKYPITSKGNPSFDDEVLASIDHPFVKLIQEHRFYYKQCNTYFRNFLYYADTNDIIHANINQAGTDTGRFSSSNPNSQNLTKKTPDPDWPVRRAVVPYSEDFALVMIDYEQQEYRLMLDYAGETNLINKIINEGLDVHQAIADQVGITRPQAKTMNFGLLYGIGKQKLAAQLGMTEKDAEDVKEKYFAKMPRVSSFIYRVKSKAKHDGAIYNWFGRKCHFKPEHCYRAPNHLIQGGCADIIKLAMNKVAPILWNRKSKMCLNIHDELLFNFHKSEFDLIPKVKETMESAYPHKHLPQACSIEHSWSSWHDKVEGLPSEATRNATQGKGA